MRISSSFFCIIATALALICPAAQAAQIAWDSGTMFATAHDYTPSGDRGPWKTIDGSGMSGSSHNNIYMNMWHAGITDAWIQWDLGESFFLEMLHVWNFNEFYSGAPDTDTGIASLDINLSIDGITWTTFSNQAFSIAPANSSYSGFDHTLGDGSGVAARYIRFDNLVSFRGLPLVGAIGLAEITFHGSPVPEPSRTVLLLLGLGTALLRRR